MRRAILLFLLVGTIPFIGQAQQHGGGAVPSMPGAHAFAAAAPRAAAHPAQVHSSVPARPIVRNAPASTRVTAAPRTAHPTGWNHTTTRRSNFSTDPVFPNGGFSRDDNPVPGLGFDYPHFFATHPNAGHHRFRHDSGFVILFIYVGFFMPVPLYTVQGVPTPHTV